MRLGVIGIGDIVCPPNYSALSNGQCVATPYPLTSPITATTTRDQVAAEEQAAEQAAGGVTTIPAPFSIPISLLVGGLVLLFLTMEKH